MQNKACGAAVGRDNDGPRAMGLPSALRRPFLAISMAVLVVASIAMPAGRAIYRGAAWIGLVSATGMPRDLRSTYVCYVVWGASAMCVWLLAVIWLAREAGDFPQATGWRAWGKWLSTVGFVLLALVACFASAPPEPAFGPVSLVSPRLYAGLFAWAVASVVGAELVLGWLAVGLLVVSRPGRRTSGGVVVGLLFGLVWWICLGVPWFAVTGWMGLGRRVYLCLLGPLAWAPYGSSWMKLWLWSLPLLLWAPGLIVLTEYCRRVWPRAPAVDAARALADVVAVVPAVVLACCFPFGGRWVFRAREIGWSEATRAPAAEITRGSRQFDVVFGVCRTPAPREVIRRRD
jgi:hypothetical protein